MLRPMLRCAPLLALVCLAACSAGKEGGQSGSGGARTQGTPTVGFVVAKPTSVEMVTELAGRTTAFESSDVRPQVTGVIRRRLFTEGTLVQRGQTLYEIDPRLYRAAANQAEANLQSARANAEATRTLAERYKPLADIEAISRQDYTNALASARQAAASVAQTSAALETARVNLGFTTVPAPITGRIGRSLFTVGALVSASQADPLAQIQRLDPMFVDIQQSAADMLALRRALGRGGIVAARAAVELTLEDGEPYGRTGSVEFSEAIVNQQTGTVTLRARFPNPDGLLLPGMFVRGRFAEAINSRAFLVPQAAITRDPKGNATLFVVDQANKIIQKTVRADRTQGASWVVTEGLAVGDRIVTQGISKIKADQVVKAVPEDTAQRIEAPSKDKAGQAGQSKAD
ncbi:efflux RND transporter periplasmic adaptor subunit [Sphingomonas sp.]|uniref:efflux RND transporter periplasmic adaptor subunit n=1 Tax=Sphingomonas sp. TaxID=28214 RepID=UPI0025F7D591|nr:efflux RND transporter periplasmic adaptor subunit [Sphingomonas sp.]